MCDPSSHTRPPQMRPILACLLPSLLLASFLRSKSSMRASSSTGRSQVEADRRLPVSIEGSKGVTMSIEWLIKDGRDRLTQRTALSTRTHTHRKKRRRSQRQLDDTFFFLRSEELLAPDDSSRPLAVGGVVGRPWQRPKAQTLIKLQDRSIEWGLACGPWRAAAAPAWMRSRRAKKAAVPPAHSRRDSGLSSRSSRDASVFSSSVRSFSFRGGGSKPKRTHAHAAAAPGYWPGDWPVSQSTEPASPAARPLSSLSTHTSQSKAQATTPRRVQPAVSGRPTVGFVGIAQQQVFCRRRLRWQLATTGHCARTCPHRGLFAPRSSLSP